MPTLFSIAGPAGTHQRRASRTLGTHSHPCPAPPPAHLGVTGAPTPVRPPQPSSAGHEIPRLAGNESVARAAAGERRDSPGHVLSSHVPAGVPVSAGRPSHDLLPRCGALVAGRGTGDVPRRINTVPGGSRFMQLEVCHASVSVIGAVIERPRAEPGVSRPPVSSIRRTGTMPINSQEGTIRKDARMSNHPNIDETIVLDLSIYRRELVRHLYRDGVFCDGDARIVALFDAPHQELSRVTRCRRALESALHGITRHTRALAADAGVAFVADGQQVTNVTQLPIDTQKRREDGTPHDAA